MENVTKTVSDATAAASKLIFGEKQPATEETNTTTTDTTTNTGGPSEGISKSEGATGDSSITGDTDTTPGTGQPTGATVGAADPASGAAPHQKQQGADRPGEEPSAGETEAIRSKKEAAEEVQEEGEGEGSGDQPPPRDPNDHSGEPLEKTRGGAAGASSGGDSSGGSDQKDSMGSTSKEPGTGEKYVKSSGLAAEGGDFDATKPGAGREADRLLEEKGVHREGNTGPPQDIGGDSSSSGKPSVGQKIKDKLHIGKKD